MKRVVIIGCILLTSIGFAQDDVRELRDQLRELGQPDKPQATPTPTPAATGERAYRSTPRTREPQARNVTRQVVRNPPFPLDGVYLGQMEINETASRSNLRCAAILQADTTHNQVTIRLKYPTTDLVRRIAGRFQGNIFRGRAEGEFSGIVYSYAEHYMLTFSDDRRSVRVRSWPVNPPPGYADDHKAEILYRSGP